MNAIEVKDVTKAFKNFTLNQVNLALPQGTVLGLVGENGAGKTTLIKLIMGALKADYGTIKVFGQANQTKAFTTLKEDIGVVLAEAYFPEVLNALELEKILKLSYPNWDKKLYLTYLEQFHLLAKQEIKEYSRGMKMKLALATALAHKPKLLILDEATAGLDPLARQEILSILNEFMRAEDHSILLSSHIISDLEKICDYICFIHAGKVLLSAEKDALLNEYALVKLSEEDFKKLANKVIVRADKTAYGYDALVYRELLPANYRSELTTLEDIILFFAKEGH